MKDTTILTESELKAIAYFVVGVATEGNIGGEDVSNRLSFAGEFIAGKLHPAENSSYSLGTLQKDLGQDGGETARALVSSYQAWAPTQPKHPELNAQQVRQTVSDLARNGNTIREQEGRPLDLTIRSHLDAFLRTEDGKAFVHKRDMTQVEHVHSEALSRLIKTTPYNQAELNEKIIWATTIAKSFNQNEDFGYNLLKRIEEGQIKTLDNLSTVVNSRGRALRDGNSHALQAAKILQYLHRAPTDHPLHDAWSHVLDTPLVVPHTIDKDPRPNFAAEYTVIRNLFLERDQAPKFLQALEDGKEYRWGRPQVEAGRKPTAGFYASGSDLVQWNKEGHGVALLDGQWTMVERDRLSRERQADGSLALNMRQGDGSVNLLTVTASTPQVAQEAAPRGLRQGMRGEDVRELQVQLNALGHPLPSTGYFGSQTQAAVLAFQQEHGVTTTGTVGPQTRAALAQANEAQVAAQKAEQPAESIEASRSSTPGQQATLLRLDDPAHTDHAFFQQVRDQIHALDRELGRQPDHFSDQLASALAVQARADGLNRVDHVALASDGQGVWAMESRPAPIEGLFDQRSRVPVQAAELSMEQSAAAWPQAMQHHAEQQQARELEQSYAQQQQQAIQSSRNM